MGGFFAGGKNCGWSPIQLTAMARGTAQLARARLGASDGGLEPARPPGPAAPRKAMSAGCLWGLAAAIAQALERPGLKARTRSG